ncbi:MAG: TMEM143 family protein [Planctomycetaceae bacterium]|jgi:hypothetical protein|nr:TMEM143 family protein [Planctomycetaceae bacterium]
MARSFVNVDPEHFIPVPRHRLVDAFVEQAGERGEGMSDLCRLLEGLLHFEFREMIEHLKRDYSLFDPKSEGSELEGLDESQIVEAEQRFMGNFVRTIQQANFVPISQEDLDVANAEDYLFSLPVEVDWERHDTDLLGTYFDQNPYGKGGEPPDFARKALLFRRGTGVDSTEGILFLQKVDLLVSRILLGLIRLPGRLLGRGRVGDASEEVSEAVVPVSESIFEGKKIERITLHAEDVGPRSLLEKTRLQEPTFKQLILMFRLKSKDGEPIDRSIHVKTFLEIPMADLEVVFPAKRLSMKPIDLIKVITTAVTGLAVVIFKLAAAAVTLNPLLLVVVLGSLGAYAARAIVGYRTSRARYQHLVTDALYSKSLDNGLGVILYLVDCMEEQEWKEALLAWILLDRDGSCTPAELDRRCEEWLNHHFEIETDFEIDDALCKLQELELVAVEGDRWQACDLDTALARLDTKWDNYFCYSESDDNEPVNEVAD